MPSNPKHIKEPGQMLDDEFVIYSVLGEGGFGIVYLAYSRDRDKLFALKTLRDEWINDTKSRQKFYHEAKVWIDLGANRFIVQAYFIKSIRQRPYIGIEYVSPGADGLNTLEKHLEDRPPGGIQSLKWAIQICSGMEYALSRGLRCHRDIKPENIMISQGRICKVTDFGLAGLYGGRKIENSIFIGSHNAKISFSMQTRIGEGFGTPPYMAPEQFYSAYQCDQRSDIYSLGIVMHRLFSNGAFPFDSYPQPDFKCQEDYWRGMHELHSGFSYPRLASPIHSIIKKCLSKNPPDRYPSFSQLRIDLQEIYHKLYRKDYDPYRSEGLGS